MNFLRFLQNAQSLASCDFLQGLLKEEISYFGNEEKFEASVISQ